MGGIIFASILGLAIVIVIWVYVAKEFQHIAALKGHDESKYFWWTFLLGIIGILMVVAIPTDSENSAPVFRDELPEL